MADTKIIGADQIKAGTEIPFLTERFEFVAGDYKAGDIVELDDTKKIKKCEDPKKIYGVVADSITIDDKNTHSTVYLSGIFLEKNLGIEASIDKDELKTVARTLNIYFR